MYVNMIMTGPVYLMVIDVERDIRMVKECNCQLGYSGDTAGYHDCTWMWHGNNLQDEY